jgi:hypothetical protein
MNYGDIGDTFYIVLDGVMGVEVPMKIDSEDPEESSEQILFAEVAQKRKGEYFGELALITD